MSRPMDGADIPGAQQVVELLEVYADARLSPRGAVLARMRRHVLADAAARAVGEDAQLQAAIDTVTPRRSGRPLHLSRRLAAVGLAATLTFATSAAVLAAPPGSPLYGARVQLEQVFLPSQTEDRVAAHERYLLERLAEARVAANRGDVIALAAALAAYRAEVDAAVADVGSDPELLAHLEAELSKHTAMLQALAALLPEQAAIEHAIDASQDAASTLKGKSRPTSPGQPGPRVTPPPAGPAEGESGADQNQQR